MRESSPLKLSKHMHINFQRIFRSLNFGRSVASKPQYIVTAAQRRILAFFADTDVVHISTISRFFDIPLQNVNNLVRRLEAMGYVKRTQNTHDKRLADIRLTSKGRKWFDENRNEQTHVLTKILSNLNPAERRALHASIEMTAILLEKGCLHFSSEGSGNNK